jgi:hypothetical protein
VYAFVYIMFLDLVGAVCMPSFKQKGAISQQFLSAFSSRPHPNVRSIYASASNVSAKAAAVVAPVANDAAARKFPSLAKLSLSDVLSTFEASSWV